MIGSATAQAPSQKHGAASRGNRIEAQTPSLPPPHLSRRWCSLPRGTRRSATSPSHHEVTHWIHVSWGCPRQHGRTNRLRLDDTLWLHLRLAGSLSPMAATEADILIVGAGLAGAATAYHLARCSDRPVTIIEKETTPGEHSSGRNAAFIREYAEDQVTQPMTTEGAAFLRKNVLADYHKCGSVLLGLGDDDVAEHFPLAQGRGRWCPDDGTLDVAALLHAYLSGHDIRLDTEVLQWQRQGDVLHVRTNRETFTCSLLVNATGPWAGTFGNLPLTPMARHLFVTRPMNNIDPAWPFVWDLENGLYFRPESGGLLLGPCDETPTEPGDYTEDPAMLEDMGRKLLEFQPKLSNVSIMSGWVGQRTFAPDRRFVIGPDWREPALFHIAALGGHGVTGSYAVGKLAAELLLGEACEHAHLFAPDRFA